MSGLAVHVTDTRKGVAGEREQEDDAILVARAARGDRDAFRVLVERHQHRSYRLAFEVTRSKEDAEDVIQESFVKAYLALPSFKGESAFSTWLHRIVYNMAIDVRRKRSGKERGREEFDELKIVPGSDNLAVAREEFHPHARLVSKESAGRIQEELNTLSEEHRAVVILREIEGMSYEEIADVVGVSKGTVMSRLHYARKRLQRGLRDLRGSEGDESIVEESEHTLPTEREEGVS